LSPGQVGVPLSVSIGGEDIGTIPAAADDMIEPFMELLRKTPGDALTVRSTDPEVAFEQEIPVNNIANVVKLHKKGKERATNTNAFTSKKKSRWEAYSDDVEDVPESRDRRNQKGRKGRQREL
jgi:hypothetical protein